MSTAPRSLDRWDRDPAAGRGLLAEKPIASALLVAYLVLLLDLTLAQFPQPSPAPNQVPLRT
ncbi:MAG: hypothetical protein IRY99_07400, partial [Isosphaeraceae bacterium]|nr:hypothetical protein [Isosphaeraceae bacterium]